MSLINKLRSSGLVVNESNIKKIEKELNYLGFPKITKMLSIAKEIDDIVNLYIYDCKIATFFWKHIRRVETNFKALIINYFENEGNPRFIELKKVNKEFAIKYLKYVDGNSKEDQKTFRMSKNIISKIKKVDSNSNICLIISKMSLGNLIDFFDLLDSEKFNAYDTIKHYKSLSELVSIRNKIAHHQLLVTEFDKEQLENFWKTIKTLSLINPKTYSNEKEITELIKNVYNNIRVA